MDPLRVRRLGVPVFLFLSISEHKLEVSSRGYTTFPKLSSATALGLLPGRFLLRHLGTFLACLGKPNRNGLFAARHLLTRLTAFQRSLLLFVYCFLDLLP